MLTAPQQAWLEGTELTKGANKATALTKQMAMNREMMRERERTPNDEKL